MEFVLKDILVHLEQIINFILPNLNKETITFFDKLPVKLVTLFIIIYISISNPILAILLSLALVLTLQELNKQTGVADILDYVPEEDLEDLEDIQYRISEPNITFDTILSELEESGKI